MLKKWPVSTSRVRKDIVSRARELANSGQHSSWMSIEAEMRSAGQIPRLDSPLDDYFLRSELDFLCASSRRLRSTG